MLQNYIKIALRNLLKNKMYSFVNMTGLAIGILCFLLIVLWVRDELSYDAHHTNAGRIYRVVIDFVSEHGVHDFARTAPLYAPTLEKDFPEVERAARFKTYGGVMKYGEKAFYENDILVADPAALQMFTFPLLKGDPATALSEPKSLILSESMAKKYFGNENPLGKIILLKDTLDCKVTGVIAELPTNTHLNFNCLLSWETWRLLTPEKWLNTWASNIYYTYIMLREGSDAAQLCEKLPAFADRYINDDEYTKCVIHLQPLRDIHLFSHRRQEMAANGSIAYVYIFSLVALLVLAIACINFMNLATARSVQRSKEVGLRKVVGAGRGNLIAQFLGESLLMSAFAMLLALMLVELVLPVFNEFSGKQIRFVEVLSPASLGAFLALTLLVGLAAGSYPALLLSGFRPVYLFKTRAQKGIAGVITQKMLIVFQFVISIALIIGTMIVSGQLNYLRQQNLGFEKEQLVVLPFGWDRQIQQQIEPLKADLLNRSGIISVTASGDVPGHMATTLSFRAEGMAEGESAGIVSLIVDPDFLKTYQIELLAGRDYSPGIPTDISEGVILNEKAVAELGWPSPEAAIGKRFHLQRMEGRVIGVVKDFNFNSLHQSIEPLAMAVWPDWFGYISIRVAAENVSNTVKTIENAWERFIPNRPFRYYFLNERFDEQYRAEERMQEIFTYFSALAIFIACLGLYGLAAYMAERRTKEIGVRKVLGATVPGIVRLMSRDFLKPVLLANIIAWPLAWYGMSKWLEDFAYRIDIGWWIFALAGGLALVIALLTVSTQAVRAALANPVEALRYE